MRSPVYFDLSATPPSHNIPNI